MTEIGMLTQLDATIRPSAGFRGDLRPAASPNPLLAPNPAETDPSLCRPQVTEHRPVFHPTCLPTYPGYRWKRRCTLLNLRPRDDLRWLYCP
jgi:hypothetical protein